MLTHIQVRDFVIAQALDIEFQAGMVVISGETGAGKSVVLDAINLALGARADSHSLRPGALRAQVCASFDIRQLPRVQHWLRQNELDQDDAECIVRRTVNAQGRSQAYINGQRVALSSLKHLAPLLMTLHSQHAQQALVKPEQQLQLLDRYAQLMPLRQQINAAYQQWQALSQQMHQAQRQQHLQHERQQLLQYQWDELQQFALQADEAEHLEAQFKRLSQSTTLLNDLLHCKTLIRDDHQQDVVAQLDHALRLLERHHHSAAQLQPLTELLRGAQIHLQEALDELEQLYGRIEHQDEHLAQIEARLNQLYELARKHRVQPQALHAHGQQMHDELEHIRQHTQHYDLLAEQLIQAQQAYTALATQLSQQRAQAVPGFEQALQAKLVALSMADVHFRAQLSPSESDTPAPWGLEQMSYHASMNPGQAMQPLAKVASGGELSRISLAVQVICAVTADTPTLIFDEVDVGVGGRVAEVIGQLLQQIGQQRQVICVTHLAQVAAQGHQHLRVTKTSHQGQTCVQIDCLSLEQRIAELARMLGGIDITPHTQAHAQEMLQRAQQVS